MPRGLAAILLMAASAVAQGITEKEAVRRFLGENPVPRQLEAGVEATRADTRGWSLWPNPTASYSREGAGLTEFYQFQQPLALSGRLAYLRQAGASAVSAARWQASHTRWEWISELRSVFYQLLAAQQQEAALRSGLTQLAEVVQILRQREREGEASTYDRRRAERERSELETELAAVESTTIEARARLAAFLAAGPGGGQITAQGQWTAGGPAPSAAELQQRALAIRGDYNAESQQVTQFELQQRAAGRLRIPEPAVVAGLKRGDVGGRVATGGLVAISVPLPLFNRGDTEVARFRAEAERADSRRQALRHRIQAEVTSAFENLELRRRALGEYQRAREAQERPLEQIARTAYDEGEIGILELLDAYRVGLRSQLRFLELAAAAKQAEIALERAVGEPVLNLEVLP
jgi:cobalt-zinc-cadmium efflux system outer membrane protein